MNIRVFTYNGIIVQQDGYPKPYYVKTSMCAFKRFSGTTESI